MSAPVYRPDARLKHRLPRGGNRCDFCGDSNVLGLYACHNFDWQGRPVFERPSGRWAACFPCCTLIDAGKWSRLVSRVMREVAKRKGTTEDELKTLRKDLRGLYVTLAANLDEDGPLRVMGPKVTRLILN